MKKAIPLFVLLSAAYENIFLHILLSYWALLFYFIIYLVILWRQDVLDIVLKRLVFNHVSLN